MEIKQEDRRIRRTKKLLKNGLATLMQQKDFKDIRVKDITDLVDLNRGTFYLHYSDTYDLLDKIESEVLDDFQNMINSYHGENSTFLPVINPLIDYVVDNVSICKALFVNKNSSDFLRNFEELIRKNGTDYIHRNFPNRTTDNSNYYFAYATYAMMGLLKEWFDRDMKLPRKKLVNMMDKLLTNAAECIL